MDATRVESRAPFIECARCSAPLRDHWYADLAVAAVGSPEEEALTGVIEDEAWDRLPAVTGTMSPPEGGVTFRALRCPSGGGSVVPLLLAHSVIGDDCVAGTVCDLSEADLETLLHHGRATWHPYSDSWVARAHK
jgi:hypothetical protein